MTTHCQQCGLPFYVSQAQAESGPIYCSTFCEEDAQHEQSTKLRGQDAFNADYERELRRHSQLMDIAAGYGD